MKKISLIILIIFVVAAAFIAGAYFENGAKNIQKADVGSLLSQVEKQIFTPAPLNMGGAEKQVTLLQSKVIEQTNFQRALNQSTPLQALKENALLDQAAAAKAQDMFKNQYFEHVSPSGVNPGQLVQNFGYNYIVEGENLILGNFSSEKEMVDDWMASPGHRANILNSKFTEIGVAVVKGKYKGENVWIGVQEFGRPLSACQQPSTEIKNEIDSNKAELDSVSLQINQQKDQINQTNQDSSVYQQMINDYNALVEQYNSLVEKTKSLIANYNLQVNNFNNCVND